MVGIGLKIRLEEERKGNKIFKIMFRSAVMLKLVIQAIFHVSKAIKRRQKISKNGGTVLDGKQ